MSEAEQPVAIVRLRNPQGLYLPAVVTMLAGAFPVEHATGFPALQDVLVWLHENVSDERVGVLLARQGDRFPGFAVCAAPSPPWALDPWVLHFHAPRNAAVRDVLCRGILAWMEQNGFHQFSAINRSALDDETWVQLWNKMPVTIVPTQTIYEFYPEGTEN